MVETSPVVVSLMVSELSQRLIHILVSRSSGGSDALAIE